MIEIFVSFLPGLDSEMLPCTLEFSQNNNKKIYWLVLRYIVHSLLLPTGIISAVITVSNLLWEIDICWSVGADFRNSYGALLVTNELNINIIDFSVIWWCFLWHWHYVYLVVTKRLISISVFSTVLMSMTTTWLLFSLLLVLLLPSLSLSL